MDPSALVFAAMRRLAPLSERETRAIAPLLRPYSVPEGGWLLRAGERAEHSYFVLEGLVRELYVSEDGTEHTRVFVPEGPSRDRCSISSPASPRSRTSRPSSRPRGSIFATERWRR